MIPELLREDYSDCIVLRCKKNTKEFLTRAGEKVLAEPSDEGNLAMRNGIGGLLVVDIDGKNGGSLQQLFKFLPPLKKAKTGSSRFRVR